MVHGHVVGTCWLGTLCLEPRPRTSPRPSSSLQLRASAPTGHRRKASPFFIPSLSYVRQPIWLLQVVSRYISLPLCNIFGNVTQDVAARKTGFSSQATTVLLPSLFSCFCEVAAAQTTCPGHLGPCLQCLSQPHGRRSVPSLQPGCHGPFSTGQPAACLCGCSTCYLLESCLGQQPQK